jgi:hypothetical protein
MAFLLTVETSHNILIEYIVLIVSLLIISYSNLTNYYFVNYNHLVLYYVVDYCIDFDYLVHCELVIVFVLVPLAILFILHVLV